jgi:hypothetical protein
MIAGKYAVAIKSVVIPVETVRRARFTKRAKEELFLSTADN